MTAILCCNLNRFHEGEQHASYQDSYRPSLDKALCILELLRDRAPVLHCPDLVDQSGPREELSPLSPVTLERRGYVHRNERAGRYSVRNMKLFSLANSALERLELR